MRNKAYTQLKDTSLGHLIPLWTHGGHYYATPESMPNEVSVYGQKFKVYYHSRIYAERKKKARLLGIVIFSHRLIFIEPGQSIHMMRESLYHEIAHVYTKVWQTKSESLAGLSYQQIEDICNMFGEAIPDLASNNKISV